MIRAFITRPWEFTFTFRSLTYCIAYVSIGRFKFFASCKHFPKIWSQYFVLPNTIISICLYFFARCGQKKKLVINNGKGAVEDKKIGGLNGEASKSQEMVHLVHKEQSNDRTGQYDEFLTTDETQNQEADMKTGV